MNFAFVIFAFLFVVGGFRPWIGAPLTPGGNESHFASGSRLLWPEGYRQWVWLSSGLGMSYSPQAMGMEPQFDNVFVDPASYQYFVQNGRWPDGTRLVLEERDALSHGSINKSGHFQGTLRGVEVEVKDAARFRGKWAFFSFGLSTKPTEALPTSAQCYSCHAQNGAVDNTFVQFYPTLAEIAKQKGTFK